LTRTPIVGVGGSLRSGKDTFADFLVKNHGYTKVFMSEPLADALYVLNPIIWVEGTKDRPEQKEYRYFGRTYKDIFDSLMKANDGNWEETYTQIKRFPEVRSLLQRLGTDVGRNMLGEDTWVNIAKKKLLDLAREGKPAVITGIRFPNEFEMIENIDGYSVWVDRPDQEDTRDKSISQHASETSVSPEDFRSIILNNGTLKELEWKATAYHVDLISEWL
jgi:hypothetical protein